MTPDSRISLYARFAGLSLLVTLVLAGVFAFGRSRDIRASHEQFAAEQARSTYGIPVARLFEDVPAGSPVTTGLYSEANLLVLSMHTPGLHGVKVWDGGDAPIYSAGPSIQSDHPTVADGETSYEWSVAIGERMFVTQAAVDGRVIEVFQNGSTLSNTITSAQRTMLVQVAGFAGTAWVLLLAAFSLAVRKLLVAHRRLLWMYKRGDEIRSSLDLNEVVTNITRDSTLLAGGRYGMVTLFDDESQELTLRATYDHGHDIVAHQHRPVEEWFLRRCIATNSTLVSTTTVTAWRQCYGMEAALPEQIALLCAPISLRGRALGVIAIVREMHGRHGFGGGEVRQVEELAGQAVTAVEQAQLFAKVRSYADEIELNYDATLKALMAALDTKDEVTEGHCERVAKLTVHLAREMGVPESELVDIERGALLHDVGKIGVPDEVLKKPASLNDKEWEAMRKHPLLAGVLVSKVGFLEGALPILLYHHERWDGGGYPFGLTAEKIPLEARIFSVIDAYDAMTSDRPYREAMSHAEAMAEIEAHKWSQFDPEVVEVFQRMMAARPELQHHDGHRLSLEHDEHDDYLTDDGADRDVA